MRISLLPKAIFPALTEISPDYLRGKGIRRLMLDFDNTIVPYTTDVPTPEMERWLRDLNRSDIQVCVVSNSKKRRVMDFCEKYDLRCVTHARKPFSCGIRRCLSQSAVAPRTSATIPSRLTDSP